MGNVGEHEAEEARVAAVSKKKAGSGVKVAAGGVAEHIGDIGTGAGKSAVLIIDRSIDVIAVGMEEELCGIFLAVPIPGLYLEAERMRGKAGG